MTVEGWEVAESLTGTGDLFAGDEGDADFSRGDGSDVGLAVVAPIDFDESAPGSDGIVLAEADAAGVDDASGEPGPGCDAGLVAVGTDEEAGAEGLGAGVGAGVNDGDVVVSCDAADRVLPVEADAEAGGTVEQELVQGGAAYAASGSCGERGLNGGIGPRRG